MEWDSVCVEVRGKGGGGEEMDGIVAWCGVVWCVNWKRAGLGECLRKRASG